MQTPTTTDLILPTLILSVWGMGLLLITLAPRQHRALLPGLTLVGLAAAPLVAFWRWGRSLSGFGGAIVLDNYALFLTVVFAVAGGLTVLLSYHYLPDRGITRREYYPLLLLSLSGMTLMAAVNDLVVLFIALELLSIPLYVLAAIARPDARSEEAGLKYFLLGAFASAFLIYGIALIYGGAGTTALPELHEGMQGGNVALVLSGAGLVLVGLAFKVAAVPFHMWTPDVYQGAPTPVTAFMSVGAKAAGFAALGRLFLQALPAMAGDWSPVVAVLAALTMVLGNVVALVQSDIKRMLAYSSIAHAGYLLMGVAAHNERGLVGMLFYLLAYAFTNLGAFAVLTALARPEGEDTSFTPYAGLAKRRPWVAAAMALFMFSLTGIPPTGGFAGKYYLFWATVEADLTWLAVIGVLTSLVSAFFYLRVVVTMYFHAPADDTPLPLYRTLAVALLLTAAVTLALGLGPGAVLNLAQETGWSSLLDPGMNVSVF